MLRDLLMPKLGLTMAEGLIIDWKVAPGDAFAKGDPLLVIETDKIAMEIEAEFTGMMAEILVSLGNIVPVGSVIARWRSTADTEEAFQRSPASARRGTVAEIEVVPSAADHPIARVSVLPVPTPGIRTNGTPLARRFARQHGIDLGKVLGSEPSVRISMADVQVATVASAKVSAQFPTHETRKERVAQSIDLGIRVPAGPAHAAMARRLMAVEQEVPQFYLAAEAEVTALLAFLETLNTDSAHPRITINHIVIAAIGRALHDLPQANRIWGDSHLVTFAGTDVGIAVHTPRGLFVPILRDAGRAKLDTVAVESARLIEKTRKGRLQENDLTGGAVAVSNVGMFNVSYLTPIINPGHSAILEVGSVRRFYRHDAGGRPALRQEIGLLLACDRRVFDGAGGLEFLNLIIARLENPFWLSRGLGIE